MGDLFSKYIYAIPLRDQDAESITQALYKEWISGLEISVGHRSMSDKIPNMTDEIKCLQVTMSDKNIPAFLHEEYASTRTPDIEKTFR